MLRLTFDDGPSEWTPAILDLLAEHDRKATFFVVGASIPGHSRTMWRLFQEGHRIGNHTFSHRRLTELSSGDVKSEFRACQSVVELACGVTPTVWRAPMFSRNEEIDLTAAALGLTHMGADIIPDDWRKDDPEHIADLVISRASPKAIVCLHDGMPPDGGNGVSHRQATVDAVRIILEAGQ